MGCSTPDAAREGAYDVDEPIIHLSERSLSALDACVHCGLCQQACPTYSILGLEADSPRGRIHLIRGAQEGSVGLSAAFLEHMDLCLACRACETACPSNVRYGGVIEEVRSQVSEKRQRSWLARTARNWAFRRLLADHRRLRRLTGLLRFAQRTGADRLGARLLPQRLAGMQPALPALPARSGRETIAPVVPAQGEKRCRVGFFLGCVMDTFYAGSNAASVRVLAANGCEVVTPAAQECCGAVMIHGGDLKQTLAQARRNIAAFEAAGVDYVIINAAGCGTTLKDYGHLLAGDPAWAERAQAFTARVRDLTEFLVQIGPVAPTHAVAETVAYHDPCHLAHGQGIRSQPRQLLQSIPGLKLVDLPESDWCCGAAGIYNIEHFDLSMQVLDRKMENIGRTGVRTIVTANPPCLLQLRLGAHRHGVELQVVHLVDLLDRAYGGDRSEGGA